jgi:endonuclease YncB( thermonuclease family)
MKLFRKETKLGIETEDELRRRKRARIAVSAVILVVGAGASWLVYGHMASDTGGPPDLDRLFTSSYSARQIRAYDSFRGVSPRPMPICGAGARENCVINGKTFWLNGLNIRISNIDTPRIDGRCAEESRVASEAARTLARLLDRQRIEIRSMGRKKDDEYLLAEIYTPDGDVSEKMVRWRVAVPWRGRQEPVETWCGA